MLPNTRASKRRSFISKLSEIFLKIRVTIGKETHSFIVCVVIYILVENPDPIYFCGVHLVVEIHCGKIFFITIAIIDMELIV
uniref:Uncharacterized protein n=1 Tax=Lepeophtheirus salmonis TaxID=72036 RepID=A0A0K2V6E2_LEPSM